MTQAGNQSYSVVRVPGAEHSMLIARTGGFKEARSLTSYSLAYFRLLGEWLRMSRIIDTVPPLASLEP
jgi:hypothetical protein